jgi:hypothetical protein
VEARREERQKEGRQPVKELVELHDAGAFCLRLRGWQSLRSLQAPEHGKLVAAPQRLRHGPLPAFVSHLIEHFCTNHTPNLQQLLVGRQSQPRDLWVASMYRYLDIPRSTAAAGLVMM